MITREEAKELLPIIQAFAEGKAIQDKIEGITDWVDTDEINFEYEGQKIKHRIKPKPKYRPFKNQEECWQEMLKHHPFGWIQTKKIRKPRQINKFTDLCIVIMEDYITFRDAMVIYEYEFIDGTPFGIIED